MKRAVIAAVVTAVALLLIAPAVVLADGAQPPSKITRDLAALPAQHAAARAAGIPLAVPNPTLPVRGDWVTIDAVAAADPAALAADLTALGARNVAVAGHLVSARFPIAAIPS